MENFQHIIESTEITWDTALIRILISFIIGAIVGIEREAHNQPAGLRTHILISIGSTIVMLISIYIPQTFTQFQNGDPGRIAAQVISGIGFLGAGAILKFGGNVKGLTTAASIWTMAALGLAVGAGMYGISFVGLLVILFALTIMDVFEKKVFKERSFRKIELLVKKKDLNIEVLQKEFHKLDIKVLSTGLERNVQEAHDKVTFMVGVTKKIDIQKLVEMLGDQPGTVTIAIEIIE